MSEQSCLFHPLLYPSPHPSTLFFLFLISSYFPPFPVFHIFVPFLPSLLFSSYSLDYLLLYFSPPFFSSPLNPYFLFLLMHLLDPLFLSLSFSFFFFRFSLFFHLIFSPVLASFSLLTTSSLIQTRAYKAHYPR